MGLRQIMEKCGVGVLFIWNVRTTIKQIIHHQFKYLVLGIDLIKVGSYGGMATKTDGTLWAWGLNGDGCLGQNNREQ